MDETQNSPHAYRMIFAQNIRQIRRMKEISQEELAFAANISRVYIGEVERGSRNVTIDVMGRISDALEVPLDKLLLQDLTKIG
ncbi:transcriptional regulator [Neisseria bacilliformis ATCC BAA-1200]|jgi:transcriptional regulator, pvuIIC|uniref:Transcriptional regulator n=2 Tax=Neisseria TaxID=482 RepID=F2BGD8_9NEIS|nr:helix-turn-helix transcriptional regulator [Neisseria bacilliformis]EGF06835.1 transcriptional regulator [Neisseria bacilliformis ATCC BAA-1200]QMT47292.1 helix-turn-helix transcriptional regulator [Neisseria bacilliformis]